MLPFFCCLLFCLGVFVAAVGIMTVAAVMMAVLLCCVFWAFFFTFCHYVCVLQWYELCWIRHMVKSRFLRTHENGNCFHSNEEQTARERAPLRARCSLLYVILFYYEQHCQMRSLFIIRKPVFPHIAYFIHVIELVLASYSGAFFFLIQLLLLLP